MIIILKIAGIIFLIILLLMWMLSFYKGMIIVKYLKRFYKIRWEEMGKPRPDYLNIVIHARWKKFISQKEYRVLNDIELDKMCITQQMLEKIALILLLTFFFVFGTIAIWYKYVIKNL